jgi:phosphonate transport system permease protein
MAKLFAERGFDAVLSTLGIAVLSIVLAAAISAILSPLAATNLATRRPFHADPDSGKAWLSVRLGARATMIVFRAIPEYILAFLFLALLGPNTAWPAIAALALHNGGILGRLGAETIENLDPRPLRSLHAIGARRRSILVAGIVPQALGRYLLYFFYRFETCVREASVLGILGIVSLGYWIEGARAKHDYGEMFFFVALCASIVIASDFLSAAARRFVRRG